MATIGELEKQITNYADQWEYHYTKDYVEAYWRAFDNFDIVKAAQEWINSF